ncbi:MAG: TonB-dependent receptor [Flavisolibacter sp.]|nr:TonB-dependent receptor [Flavisolibacter sp.]
MRILLPLLTCLFGFEAFSQSSPIGIIIGNVLDEKKKALESATVQLSSLNDSLQSKMVLTDKDGAFEISDIPFGYYRLQVSYIGFTTITIDSIFFRAERYDFNMNDITLAGGGSSNMMEQVIIYAERPLIQSKDGNITFNAGESALSAGSNASDLLTNVPLVTKDPDGKLLVRGKEPKILIDDKPVELSLQQLQDLLEAMPGSSIEKIEVMTNPPPQYANEEGGVINIVTRKGSVGKSGRISVYAGTRGEKGANANFNYRRQGFSVNLNAGAANNIYNGNGYSKRENVFSDSSNYFNTENSYRNKNTRPNFRTNINYDINKFQSLNLVVQYNGNNFNNHSLTEIANLNNAKSITRLSERSLDNSGESYNGGLNLSYTLKTKRPGEALKLYNNYNYSSSETNRDFYQQFLNSDRTPNGMDSTQKQATDNTTKTYSTRLNYDLPLNDNKTFLSAGGFYTYTDARVNSDASFLRKSDLNWVPLSALINQFKFNQQVGTFRGSVKQMLAKHTSVTAGVAAEYTNFHFNLYTAATEASNQYWSYLPFANFNKNWDQQWNLTASYRKTIRRPGSRELNPTVDSADAYTIRTGNTELKPSLAHNFDLVLGRTHNSFYANIGLGYNMVNDVFAQIRSRLSDTTTQITWENISGRREYEVSTWSGYTLNRHTRVNLSVSYSYNTYSAFDKEVRKYRNGGSFTSNLNGNYVWKQLYTATGSFTFNRFANPQGTVRSSLSMNLGLQAKMLDKKLTLTLNVIDPFTQQKNTTFTYGTNFNLENYSSTRSRNYRLTVGYNLSRTQKKVPASTKQSLQKALQQVK